MNLLIIGAGGHGRVVAEIAADCGYEAIDFLDDNSTDAVAKISDLEKLAAQYTCAFVGIGNNRLRKELIDRIEACGYRIPVLIHPTASISRTAKIEKGTIVEPKAIVNANATVGKGCIISVGAIVDHDATVGQYCHINAGAIVKAGAVVEEYTKLEAGEVKLGYRQAIVKK